MAATSSPDGVWQEMPAGFTAAAGAVQKPWVQPPICRIYQLDTVTMQAQLTAAPREDASPKAGQPVLVPMPDGSYQRFEVVESPVMAPELAALFPLIKTYLGRGLDDRGASARIDFTELGFHAQILSPSGAVYVDPYWRDNTTTYASYYKRDYHKDGKWVCLTQGADATGQPLHVLDGPQLMGPTGSTLRTYRLACAATGEYTAFCGGTVSKAMSAIVTSVNRVTGVYETELAIRMVLIANNNLIVYTDPNTDPYTNDDGGTMLGQNQTTIDSVIGSANYDIGHVFSTGGGGIAQLGCVCRSSSKAQGVTGSGAPVGDAFDIDYVAHEMGHQFGANHCFNGNQGSCGGGNRNGTTAYEPGSGSTIMCYAGICGTDDLQPHSDPYFHSVSIGEITTYTTSGGTGYGCAVKTSTGNNSPTVNAGADYTIPQNTPFTLTATGSDPDGQTITYCWEQRDLGGAAQLSTPDNGSIPLFRSWNPTTSPSRTFPRLQNLLNNTLPVGEQMPVTNRTLHFRVTARDNRAGGGATNTDDSLVTVATSAGPFRVTAPNTAVSWSGAQTVTWNVANTTAAPVSTATVNILLSTDGGNTFSITLAAATPNDGSQTVTLPNVNTTTARIKVAAVNNIYFDISDTNFTITPHAPGDFDRDGDVDATDLIHFLHCTGGANHSVIDTCLDADLDGDNDVDQDDFGIFQRCLSGSTIPADPNCAG